MRATRVRYTMQVQSNSSSARADIVNELSTKASPGWDTEPTPSCSLAKPCSGSSSACAHQVIILMHLANQRPMLVCQLGHGPDRALAGFEGMAWRAQVARCL